MPLMSFSRRLGLIAGLSAAGLTLACLAEAAAAEAEVAPPAMLGFSPAGAKAETALEAKFDKTLSATDLKAWLERMAAEPNQVGSPHDRANAEWQLAQFKAWGWDAHIETFQILYPTPITESLELLGPSPYRARLHEPPIPGDRSSADMPGVLPPYVAYQGDGDVTAELVYVNYGMPDDYRALARQGIDVKGKIVIARYGSGWRGLKPKLAQLHGAVGCIIYSDPKDDGYYTDDPYPKGAQRPADGVQRGSVQDMMLYSGDPLTPGVAATADAKRLTREEAVTILKIPALPISYADAAPLLAALGGPVANAGFRGALPLTYHVGPGPAVVHLVVKSEWSLKPIYDVIAVMKGAQYPDQWVVRGNHHDGWVFGAEDPLSGQIVLMDEAKAIGALAKTGWRPARTLIYTSWDAEEPGLIGSTEWAEAHADELQKKAVIYINSDGNGRGFLNAGGSHDYQALVSQVAEGVSDPETGVSVEQRLRARLLVNGLNPTGGEDGGERARLLAKAAKAGGSLPIGALGSGSDFTPFLQHLGLATLDFGYGGESEGGGVYHSAYDTFDHYERFGDPTFAYGIALAQTVGHTVLRLADAETSPQRFSDFADTIAQYVNEVHGLADKARDKTLNQNRLLDAGDFKLAADPSKVQLPPPPEDPVPTLDLRPLDEASARLKASAKAFDAAYAAATASGALTAAQKSTLNDLLRGIDLTLLSQDGLPGRPWFKNLVYAPGMETGYGVKTLPGVREAIEGRRWEEAVRFAKTTAVVLNAYSDRLDQALAVATAKPGA
jgi:N-acetylated-alpha-linked acidic dipeptidase